MFNGAVVISAIIFMKARKTFLFDEARDLLIKIDISTMEIIFESLYLD